MCHQKMCQIGGRKPGRPLPIPATTGFGNTEDLLAAQSTLTTLNTL